MARVHSALLVRNTAVAAPGDDQFAREGQDPQRWLVTGEWKGYTFFRRCDQEKFRPIGMRQPFKMADGRLARITKVQSIDVRVRHEGGGLTPSKLEGDLND